MTSEEKFRKRLIQDLADAGINVVDLRGGTFDLIVEGDRPYVCELKRIRSGVRAYMDKEEAFPFTRQQTREIRKMRFPPFVVAFHDGYRCHFLSPEWVKREVEDLREYKTAFMIMSIRPFPQPESYEQLVKDVVSFVKRQES